MRSSRLARTDEYICWMGPDLPTMKVVATYDEAGAVTGITVDCFPERILIINEILVDADPRFLRRDIDGFAIYADNGTARYRLDGIEPGTAGLVHRAVKVE